MSSNASTYKAEAEAILKGSNTISPTDALALAKNLQDLNAFSHARRLLALVRKDPAATGDPDLFVRLAQRQAVSTYKDPDLPGYERLDRALEILGEVESLDTTSNQETLGIAGAIFKSRWEMNSQKQLLERSLAYYLRGYQQGAAKDSGYTGINAAFVLDQLAYQEMTEAAKAGATSDIAIARREQAKQIRESLVEALSSAAEQDESLMSVYWFVVTMAEAYFGLCRYKEAETWLEKASLIEGVPAWQYESSARQLAALVMLTDDNAHSMADVESSPAWRALEVFLRGNLSAVRTAFLGKVGLGLSGGGFRASLYHIGVLARLAELDMLRHVEVLSCVSGGSIIGAHYYLEVRKLLESKSDGEITREDYIEIVKRVERDFLAGVQRNIRTRVAASLWSNIKMIFNWNYSRTERVGELYEKEIFSRIQDGDGDKPRWINNLYINPKGEPQGFKPKDGNWRRGAKVPILALNATSLNTGHNWQFTASWMGEPPVAYDNEVDRNYRLRRLYYGQAPDKFKNVRLGHAVAASSCVPGLFEPLVLDGLYEGVTRSDEPCKITVRLVDGGVHDNQGVAALLDQDCSVLLVSDASGQMNTQDDPSAGMLGVPLRSNSILMARVREAQFLDLVARRRSSLLRGLMFIHLRKDLPIEPVDWIDCDEPHEEEKKSASDQLTPYHIRDDVQRLLSAVRTDLDSFSDTEAFALMTDGYRMTEYEFPRRISGFQTPTDKRANWRFLDVEEPMKQKTAGGESYKNLMLLLKAAHSAAFKAWKILPALRVVGVLIMVALIALSAWALWDYSSVTLLTVGMIGSTVVALVAAAMFGKTVVRIVRFRETIARIVLGLIMAVFGSIAARIHLWVFDPLFLSRGRVPVNSKTISEPAGEGDKAQAASAGE